jgi:hypothetical protein
METVGPIDDKFCQPGTAAMQCHAKSGKQRFCESQEGTLLVEIFVSRFAPAVEAFHFPKTFPVIGHLSQPSPSPSGTSVAGTKHYGWKKGIEIILF